MRYDGLDALIYCPTCDKNHFRLVYLLACTCGYTGNDWITQRMRDNYATPILQESVV